MNNGQWEYEWRKALVTPLCGWDWFHKNQHRFTDADIASLTIVVGINGKELPPIRQNGKRGTIKDLVKFYR